MTFPSFFIVTRPMIVALLVGLVISLKMVRFTVSLSTSYLGAVMLGLGLLNLTLRFMEYRSMDIEPLVEYTHQQWFLPAYFMAIAVCGFVIQFAVGPKTVKVEKKSKDKDDDDE